MPLVADVDRALRSARTPELRDGRFELSDAILPWWGNRPTLSHEERYTAIGLHNDEIQLVAGALDEFWSELESHLALRLTFESIWDLFDRASNFAGGNEIDAVQFLRKKCESYVRRHEGYTSVARGFRAASKNAEQAEVQRVFLGTEWDGASIEAIQEHFAGEADRLENDEFSFQLELLFDDIRHYLMFGFEWLLRTFDHRGDASALTLVSDVARTGRLRSIVSFNQDTLLERLLGADLHDGFVADELTRDEARRIVERAAAYDKIALVKAHGSYNWYPHQTRGILRSGLGSAHDDLNVGWFHPMLLLGKRAKGRDYTKPFWEAIQASVDDAYRGANLAIVCGYSFGDAPANQQLAKWLTADKNHRMLVVLPEGPTALSNADDLTRHIFVAALASGQICAPVSARSDMDLAELEALLA